MKIVIIGNGPAAISAAETARGLDGACEIVMISKESVPFYSPCPLAEYVEASVPRDHLFLRDENFYREQRIETLFGCAAVGIDTVARQVKLASGVAVDYDRLLIANGANAFKPPIPGLADTPGVFSLKTLDDAEGILARLPQARRAVVIGSGFIGLEAAQGLVRRGLQVTVLEALGQVLPQMLDTEMSALVERRLREHGVEVLINCKAEAILGGASGITAVRAGGQDIPCDLLVCAAGVRPDLSFLGGSGIATAAGILVDTHMQTNVPDVYAAGDVVEALDTQGQHRVLANWPNATNGGRIAALNMVGVQRRSRGMDSINVVRIFDIPVSSFGTNKGERTLRYEEEGVLRKLTLNGSHIVGAQMYGDVNRTGMLYEMMVKGLDVRSMEGELLGPNFGYGQLLLSPSVARQTTAAVV